MGGFARVASSILLLRAGENFASIVPPEQQRRNKRHG
jgi:hypothetical protein